MDIEQVEQIFRIINKDPDLRKEFLQLLIDVLCLKQNDFHPLVFINGSPDIGKNVSIGFFSEINAKGSKIIIGDNCDIASFVSINVADSHKKCIGLKEKIEREPIIIENNVFIGSHCFIKGGAHIGHHSVVAAGTIVEGIKISPYSFIYGNPMNLKEGYYKKTLEMETIT
jgi:acetyltransferase-like isoleucine patch superfamily enzyme